VTARRILSKPWPWEVAGPLPGAAQALQVAADPKQEWARPEPEKWFDRFATSDFCDLYGRAAGRGNRRVVMRTRIEVEEDFDALLLLNSDDAATVWIDGKEAIANHHNAPSEGFLTRRWVRLTKGTKEIIATVNQADFADGHIYRGTLNNWKFRFRVREDDHRPARVSGAPWPE